MAIITLSILASEDQIISGIPRSVSLETNIPSTIFYTLDGSVPNLFSKIYTSAIILPTNSGSITLQAFASNGIINSATIVELYTVNILNNARLPHSTTSAQPGINLPNLYPFGDNSPQPNTTFGNPADAGVVVDDPSLPEISNGFGADGYANNFSNEPYDITNYSIIYSITNHEGETGKGIGNLPGNVSFEEPTPPPETTDQFTNMFDPRALVIYQDVDKENPNDPPSINKQFFVLEDPNKTRSGAQYFNAGLDSPPVNGTFLRQHYNPRDNTLTHYFYDSWANKWIISKAQYNPTGTFDGNMSGVMAGKNGRFVYEWQTFGRRVLF
jgi:hypothetical protein